MPKIPKIEVTLTADAEYSFVSEMGQRMRGKLPAGLKLELPGDWVYETVQPLAGVVSNKEGAKK